MVNVACNKPDTPIEFPGFRLQEAIQPVKIIRSANNLPAHCLARAFPGALVEYIEYPQGAILTQKITTRENISWHYWFCINETMCFVPWSVQPQAAVQYMLDGTMVWHSSQRSVNIIPGVYHLCRIAPESDYTVELPPGVYECFQLSVPDELSDAIRAFYGNRKESAKNEEKTYPFDHFFSIEESIKKNVERVLAGRKLCCSRYVVGADLWREEHLLKLINIWLTSEELMYRKRKWLEKDLLKIANLETYVLEHLSESIKASDTPLSQQEVVKRLDISENNFRIIMQRVHNCSWEHFIHKLRMRRAMELLLSKPYIPLAEISDMLGYTSPSNFTRAVKEYFRASPSELRCGYPATI